MSVFVMAVSAARSACAAIAASNVFAATPAAEAALCVTTAGGSTIVAEPLAAQPAIVDLLSANLLFAC